MLRKGRAPSYVWGWTLIVLGTACARYHPEPLLPEATAAALESRTLADTGLRRFLEANLHRPAEPWPTRQWDLSTLTVASLYYHPDLDVARAHWGVVSAAVRTAGGRPNPTVSLPNTYVTNSDKPSPWILGFSLDIPLGTLGQRGYRIAQARALSEAARLKIATVAWQVVGRLRAAALDLSIARRRAELTGAQLAVQRELVQLLETRLAVGEASQLDVTREHVALQRVRLSAQDADRQVADARTRLATAIGVPPIALEDVELTLPPIETRARPPEGLSVGDLRRTALLGRPDVQSTLAEYAASQSALQLEVSRQYPNLHLGPGYTWEQGEKHYALGLLFSLPVFNRNQGPIAEAVARRRETAARFTALQARVIGDLDQALVGYRAATAAVASADSLLAVQSRAEEQTRAAFAAGEVDRLALVSTRLEVASPQVARLDALAQWLRAVGLIEEALQRPLLGATGFQPAAVESNPRGQPEGRP